ncbi:MAG: sigma-70 family RNA polymerase sigma factor [Gemmataceae bacterium]|nr:sigma-70 family RNA polymerase sigma factor [Gemmataceae bacterium]
MDQQEDFLRLFLTYQAEIRAFIGSLVRDRHGSDDVFQEVALVLWKEFQRYDPTRSFGAWARGIAAKKVMQRWDRLSRMPVPFSPEAIEAVLEAYDRTEAASQPQADALAHCLEGLPDKSRQLLTLRYEQSLKLGQIAQAVDSTLDAVHKALSRLRTRLHECVERRLATNS